MSATTLPSDAVYSAPSLSPLPASFSDRLKNIALSDDGEVTLSIAGVGYVEGEYFDNEAFGLRPGSNAFVNTRLNVYGALAFGDRVRLFGALKHGGRELYGSAVPPVERDELDLHQAFIEVRFGDVFGLDPHDVLLRAGRQELHYGAGRMISIRQGPNVRQDFDGGLVRVRLGRTIVDGFAVFDVVDKAGAFDNISSKTDGVWGLYGSQRLSQRRQLDLYYLGERRRVSAYIQGVFAETRHSIGARWSFIAGPSANWSGDVEVTYQFGNATQDNGVDASIAAWSVSGHVSHAWREAAWNPAVTFTAGISSGDNDPTDSDVGTFRAPNPPGRYFGETTPFGPGNLFGGSVALAVTPRAGWTIEPHINLFWRLETGDGSYSPGGRIVRGSAGHNRFAGWESGFSTRYRVTRNWTLRAELAHFVIGSYLIDNRPATNVSRVVLGLDLAF